MKKSKSLFYSFGNFGASLTGAVFSTYVTFYYVDVLKMPSALIGAAMAVYGVWNAVNDPLLGQVSDRTRSKWGRRIPYILFGTVPFAIFFTLVWTPPVKLFGSSIPALLTYFIAAVFLYDLFYTLVVINWTALFPEMYKTQDERTRVSSYRQIFGVLGNILGVALPPVLYPALGWGAMGVSFGVLALVSFGVSLLGAKEDPAASADSGLALGESLKATFRNKSFLIYVIAAMFIQFTFVMLQAVIPFYAKYVIGVEGFKVSVILGSIFVMALFWVLFWSKVANRHGSKTTLLVSLALYGAALIPFWFARSFAAAVVSASLLGIGLAGIMILLDVMLSDIVDEDELNTGVRREGMYFGINGFLVRIAISFQSVILGAVLSSSGYDANLGVGGQPASALLGIRSLLVLVPLAAVLVAILIMKRYPLHGEKLRQVKEGVERLHAGTGDDKIDA